MLLSGRTRTTAAVIGVQGSSSYRSITFFLPLLFKFCKQCERISETKSKGKENVRRETMDAKAGARERFDTAREGLIALSHRIHALPELGFEEERACCWLSEML